MTFEQAVRYVMQKNNVSYAYAVYYCETVLGLSKEYN